MNPDLLMTTAAQLAGSIGARAIVSFTKPSTTETAIPVIWVQELQLDVLRDLTMQDVLEVCEHHMLDAAIQLYLTRRLEHGVVVGVFPYAILVYDIGEAKNFINVKEFEDIVPREVMYAVLSLAMDISLEGREGRPIGTAFIIGDGESILRRSHQAILNPFQGQPAEVSDLKNRENWESIKEFAQLDGMFVVNREGVVIAAGRYLDMASQKINLPGGLGGRHRATAAITKDIPVVGVTVSESGGVVRVFRDGACKLSIRTDVRVSG